MFDPGSPYPKILQLNKTCIYSAAPVHERWRASPAWFPWPAFFALQPCWAHPAPLHSPLRVQHASNAPNAATLLVSNRTPCSCCCRVSTDITIELRVVRLIECMSEVVTLHTPREGPRYALLVGKADHPRLHPISDPLRLVQETSLCSASARTRTVESVQCAASRHRRQMSAIRATRLGWASVATAARKPTRMAPPMPTVAMLATEERTALTCVLLGIPGWPCPPVCPWCSFVYLAVVLVVVGFMHCTRQCLASLIKGGSQQWAMWWALLRQRGIH